MMAERRWTLATKYSLGIDVYRPSPPDDLRGVLRVDAGWPYIGGYIPEPYNGYANYVQDKRPREDRLKSHDMALDALLSAIWSDGRKLDNLEKQIIAVLPARREFVVRRFANIYADVVLSKIKGLELRGLCCEDECGLLIAHCDALLATKEFPH